MNTFQPFPKITRVTASVTITEKIDGTNAAIIIDDDGNVSAQSRSRLIFPTKHDDNYGFAVWVANHADELREGLGVGHHYGEWWGQGIQRNYGLDHKRFSLFNVGRWTVDTTPSCCHVVPILASGIEWDDRIRRSIDTYLRDGGSVAAPGFMRSEGYIVYFANGMYLKRPLDKPEPPQRPDAPAPFWRWAT